MQKKIPDVLLRLMSDGQFHSGEAVGSALGVSRAAVWKQLKKLEDLGLELESVKGKGYRLLSSVDILSVDDILLALADVIDGLDTVGLPVVEVVQEVDSTNAELLRRLVTGVVVSGTTLVAERQTAGRGRRGREWISPFGKNLYFSSVWNFSNGAASLDGLSLVVGLSVVQALSELGVRAAQLKWPNDVLVKNKKLAGVLLEISGDATGLCHVVIGVGLNVKMQAGESLGITQAWTSIEQCLGVKVDRNKVLAVVLVRMQANIKLFEKKGLSAFVALWQQYDAFAGEDVVVSMGDRQVFGVAKGISDNGELLLDVEGEVQRFNGGEVSLRRTL